MKTAVVRLTFAELAHLLHLILEDGKESAYGKRATYVRRMERIRSKLLRAQSVARGERQYDP